MKIKINKPTKCAQDVHETTEYPRPWFKPKPELPAGTILEVSDIRRDRKREGEDHRFPQRRFQSYHPQGSANRVREIP